MKESHLKHFCVSFIYDPLQSTLGKLCYLFTFTKEHLNVLGFFSLEREPPTHGIDLTDSWMELNPFGGNGLTILPALEEIIWDPQPNQDAGHVVPGLDPAAHNENEDAASARLQRIEQEDLNAVRRILKQRIRGSRITVRHCWLVLKELTNILSKEVSQKIEQGQDYARILERVAREIKIPTEQDFISARYVEQDFESAPFVKHPLRYECMFEALEEMSPDFSLPIDIGECLDQLLKDLSATYLMMPGADGIFVIKDREQYARRLRALASRL
ncbi:hypothetical protein M758_1G316800 [Ceratodon purpureus]|nr:hypothetical protein M758_1G316800 [Ceratodon purpureus]